MANYDGSDAALLPFAQSPKAGYAGEKATPGTPAPTTHFLMTGYNGTTTVSWEVTGTADWTGAQYTGGGTLVVATIRVAAEWTQ